jgi:hypothetical protein
MHVGRPVARCCRPNEPALTMKSPDRARIARAVCTVSMVLLLLTVQGCAPSVADYCDTFYSEGLKFRQEYEGLNANRDPFDALVAVLGAPQELALFFAKLQKKSPDDIEPDVEVMKNALQQISDSMGENARDPILGVLNAIAVSAATRQSEKRINEYTEANCSKFSGMNG